VANSESKEFNQKNAFLEVETDDLRISIIHKSIAQTGTSFCIRKTPKVERIKEKYAIDTNYTNKEVLCLLANCVKAHMNIIVCGEPRAGKTELAKFISGYIPESERVITIEDVLEWHYKALHPNADVIEMKMNKDYDYSDGIIASLKQNPAWIMIAETRGAEIKHLIQSFTTGVNGITTLHTDDVRKIPERMMNMSEDATNLERMENTIYSFIDVGILVSLRVDEAGNQYRVIDQIAFFSNENGVHQTNVVLEDGSFYRNAMPLSIEQKFKKAKVEHPLKNDIVISKLVEQGYNIESSKDLSGKLTYKTMKEESAPLYKVPEVNENADTSFVDEPYVEESNLSGNFLDEPEFIEEQDVFSASFSNKSASEPIPANDEILDFFNMDSTDTFKMEKPEYDSESLDDNFFWNN
jgi:pilus assembly protein CpaF